MPLSIGVNLRVTGHCNQGGRKYMEDMFSVAYQQSSNDRDLEYAFFGIFDGHGGGEAATFAKENLMDIIVKQKNFWSDNDEDVLKAIRDGYVNTHYAMWRELDKWPRTASGLPSTAGTTASIAFIRKGKIYIGHVGDSGIILGYQEKGDPLWKSKALTRDHKPECGDEMARIQESGGKVVSKSGVPRVVWNRPRLGHKGPVRRSTHIDEIPFLAVARSLGDLWSYNSELNTFVVSPEPDVKVIKIDVKSYRCLIFGTDGLWNMLTPQSAVAIVQAAEKHNEKHLIASQQTGNGQADVHMWINPSKSLVDRALDRWSSTKLRADNTSVVTLMLDPPGPTHSEILLSQKREQMARAPAPPTAQNTEMNSTMNQNIHYPYSNSIHKQHQPSLLESGPNPFHKTPMTSAPPSYSEIQKQPDSSNVFVDGAVSFPNDESSTSDDNSENKYSHSPSKEEKTSNQSVIDPVQEEESIQVAEISSSNATEEHNNSTEEIDNSTVSVEVETLVVESSLCVKETSISENNDLEIDEEAAILDTTKFVLERESWLQQVPEAERYPEETENVDLQPIKFAEPQGPRLRRSVVHETTKKLSTSTNSSSSSFCSSAVMRQTSTCNRRRHSTGAPLNSQRQQQRQRRSLTPKSSVSTGATVSYLSSNNKLKRGAKIMIADDGFEEPRVGVGTRNSSLVSLDREPFPKRRTRSEDLRNLHQDENNPANQKVEQQHSRIRWPGSDAARATVVINTSTSGMQERRLSSPNSFKRRSLEKKVTPVKTIRRPSINRSTNRIQMRENFWSDQNRANRTGTNCTGSRRQTVVGIISSMAESVSASTSSAVSVPKRWLRSDTVAATPIKTLRSRNVEITGQTSPIQSAQQYNVVKPNRILESGTTKLKQQANSSSNILTTTSSNSHTPETRTKSTDCSTTPSTRTTPNRTKQNCNITSNVSNNSSCVSLNSSTGSAGSISKRVKTPYNLSARSLSTRSRIKRFSK